MTTPELDANWVDLPSLVEQVRTQTPTPDPHVLARKIASLIPPDQLHHLLETALLPLYIRQHQPRLGTAIRAANPNRPQATTSPTSTSWKVASLNAYAQLMATPVYLDDRTWRQLQDCTSADLYAAAQRRWHVADQVRRAGDQYQQLAELCVRHNATRGGDLPVEVVTEWLAQQNGISADGETP